MTLPEIAEAVRPWVSSGALVGLLGLATTFWLKNRKLSIGEHSSLRDHYAAELAGLRAQVLAVQTAADVRIANAEHRYTEAIEAADARHASCEQECARLREMIQGFERRLAQAHRASVKLFEPNASLPEDIRAQLRDYAEGKE